MRASPLTRLQAMARLRLRRADRMQAVTAAATLFGAMLVVFVAIVLVQKSIATAAAARADQLAQERRDASLRARRIHESYRTGYIVFAADGEDCEELRFDNFTGAFISIAPVDCAVRLRQVAVADEAAAGLSPNVRGMLASFQK